VLLDNHIKTLVSLDFLVVPTATFRVLFVLLVLAHDRRRVVHFNVTSDPSAAWTANQITHSFPCESTPRYLPRDRDGVYGEYFRGRMKNLGVKEVLTAARSLWQDPLRRAADRLRPPRLLGPRDGSAAFPVGALPRTR
jgi:hypothetical protein